MTNTNSVLKISDAAALGLHTMCALASAWTPQKERQLTTKEIANHLHASEAHLAKVLQRLVHVGLIHSTRGPKGGFTLAKKPEEISLLEVYEAIDGPLGQPDCLLGRSACTGVCLLGDLMHKMQRDFRELLAQYRLSKLIGHIDCDLQRQTKSNKLPTKKESV